MENKISLLVLTDIAEDRLAVLKERYDVTYAVTPESREAAIQASGDSFQAVLTIGLQGLRADEMRRMPKLEIICCMGAGYENVDMDAARAAGIVVANGKGTNDDCVADHAIGLAIAVMRNFRQLDRLCRQGVWRTAIEPPPTIFGKKMGIFGLGTVGEKIATRARGFGIKIGYHNRRRKDHSPYLYFDSLADMASWCDILVCAAPGGAATEHRVNASILDALGPDGCLINVGRGSIVDTSALADALRAKRIRGAGIDVYESEPLPPTELIDLDNVLITPHLGGWSPEATQAQFDRFLANMEGHFSRRGAVSTV